MSVMHSPVVLVLLMVFLILVVGGVFLGVRMFGARQVKDDHPR